MKDWCQRTVDKFSPHQYKKKMRPVTEKRSNKIRKEEK